MSFLILLEFPVSDGNSIDSRYEGGGGGQAAVQMWRSGAEQMALSAITGMAGISWCEKGAHGCWGERWGKSTSVWIMHAGKMLGGQRGRLSVSQKSRWWGQQNRLTAGWNECLWRKGVFSPWWIHTADGGLLRKRVRRVIESRGVTIHFTMDGSMDPRHL